MRDMFYAFNTNKKPMVNEVGGKAKALIDMTRADFPVPYGFVLSTEFFKEWMEDIRKSNEFKSLLKGVTKDKCESLQNKVERVVFSNEQDVALMECLKDFSKSDLFAIRSSSSQEDLKGLSFAGMYETELGINIENIKPMVKKVFKSLFEFRVLEYKCKNNIPIEESTIAIIIQKQIDSTVSGIGFSVNPNNNCYDELMINASYGLGEAIVSGNVTPDTYIYDKVSKNTISKKIGDKQAAIILDNSGGTKVILKDKAKEKCLSDCDIENISSMIVKCEEYYGYPVDTEWAIDDNGLYLLQARPITAYFPLYPEYKTAIGEEKHLYIDLIKVTQGFEYSMSELGGDLFSKMIVRSKQGMMPEGKTGAFYHVHGRLYMDLSNMHRAFGTKLFIRALESFDKTILDRLKNIDLSEEYRLKDSPQELKGAFKNIAKISISMIPKMFDSRKSPDQVYNNYIRFADMAFNRIDEIVSEDGGFLEKTDEIMTLFEGMIYAALPIMMSKTSIMKIEKMFKGMGLDDEIIALNLDLIGNPTSEMGYRQVELANFKEFLNTHNADEFIYKIDNRKYSKEFLEAYDLYMKKFGCRCIGEIDIASPRLYENLDKFYSILKSICIEDNAMIGVKGRKAVAYSKLLKAAKSIKKEKQFIKYAKVYNYFGIREHPKYSFVYAVDKLRVLALKLGRDFVIQNRLDCVDDIFMLSSDQITKAQNDNSYDLRKIVNNIKEARSLTSDVKRWPVMIDSRGKIIRAVRKSKDGDLVGEPISPGKVIGRAKILNEPFEKPLERGEILVARVTEPSWTPIFINAGAVVMEIGGQLQHGAVIAREYGIPCVTGILDITNILKDGDLIEVDGSSGIITRINK